MEKREVGGERKIAPGANAGGYEEAAGRDHWRRCVTKTARLLQ